VASGSLPLSTTLPLCKLLQTKLTYGDLVSETKVFYYFPARMFIFLKGGVQYSTRVLAVRSAQQSKCV
jgi:hypothetical protein